jgi:hypothetical protein
MSEASSSGERYPTSSRNSQRHTALVRGFTYSYQ